MNDALRQLEPLVEGLADLGLTLCTDRNCGLTPPD